MTPHSMLSVLLGMLVMLAVGAPATTWATTDLDRDGKADFVWRHAGTGDLAVWLMDGVTLRQGTVVATVADLGWRIVGIGDMDGDGRADLVRHHASTGEVRIWLMDGANIRQDGAVSAVADRGLRIVGVGDVDGDGKGDLVWRHQLTGQVEIWLMNGLVLRQSAVLGTAGDLNWRIASIGDVDGDGKADLVRHHALTGEVRIWLMDGVAIRLDRAVFTVPDLGWQIAGLGDVDGDGRGDLVWHHLPTGQVGVWLMDGVVLRQGTVVLTVPDLEWQIVGVGDVDGDGKADLQWRHESTGQVAVWLMDGVVLRQGAFILTVADLGWKVQTERPVLPTSLSPGVPRGSEIGVGEVHRYEFWVNAPTRVVLQATRRAGGLNPCVGVFTGTPAKPVAGGSACAVDPSGNFARLNVTLAAGIYELAVRDAGDNDEGGYNVLMLPVTGEGSAPLDAGVPEPGLVDRLGDINLYQFTLDAPTRVVVEAARSAAPRISPCLEVYTGAPAQLVSGGATCAENASGGKVSHLDLQLAAGTYFVAIHDAGEDDKGNYNLLLLPLTAATSTALTAGVPQTGTISGVGDVNLHHFTLDAPTRVVMQVIRTSKGTHGINPCLEVYAGVPAQPVVGGAVCAADTPTGRVARLDLTLAADPYFVAVRDTGGNHDGDYDVLMLPVSAAASTSLALGVSQMGTISGIGQVDLYQFSLGAPAQVQVQVTRVGKQSRVNPCLEVYTGAPARLVPGGQVCASTAFAGTVATLNVPLAGGTYFVVVYDAAADDVGDYDVLAAVGP